MSTPDCKGIDEHFPGFKNGAGLSRLAGSIVIDKVGAFFNAAKVWLPSEICSVNFTVWVVSPLLDIEVWCNKVIGYSKKTLAKRRERLERGIVANEDSAYLAMWCERLERGQASTNHEPDTK